MSNIKVLDLSENQLPFYEELQERYRRNAPFIVEEIKNFIWLKHFGGEGANLAPAVIGLSGGIDSTLTAYLVALAIGAENIIGVKMPYAGMSSRSSIEDADLAARLLGIKDIREIPINGIADEIIRAVEMSGDKMSPLDRGNAMARARMTVLYGISGVNRGRVVDTCNYTEIMVGYFTKYGDGASDYNPIGEVDKTGVWEIAKFLGVPRKIVHKTASAELEKGQTDETSMGMMYRFLDLALEAMYRKKITRDQLINDYFFTEEAIRKVREMVDSSAHKRNPVPVCSLEKLNL